MLKALFGKKRKEQSWKELAAEIKKAQKDPQFIKEVNKFIKATTG